MLHIPSASDLYFSAQRRSGPSARAARTLHCPSMALRPADRRLPCARTAAQRSPARTAIAPTPEAEAERICFAAHPAQAFLHSVVGKVAQEGGGGRSR